MSSILRADTDGAVRRGGRVRGCFGWLSPSRAAETRVVALGCVANRPDVPSVEEELEAAGDFDERLDQLFRESGVPTLFQR